VAALADGAVTLTIDGGPALDPTALGQALTGDWTELWTDVVVPGGEPFDTLHLWLATEDDTFGIIWRDPDRNSDLVKPALLCGGSAQLALWCHHQGPATRSRDLAAARDHRRLRTDRLHARLTGHRRLRAPA
jgi:hypothetical protein